MNPSEVNLYGNTELDKYKQSLSGMASATISESARRYKDNRIRVLFGASLQQVAQGQYGYVTTSGLKMADRVAAWGSSFAQAMIASTKHKAFVEDRVADAVESLGGWDNISEKGEWAFLFEDVIKDSAGKITGYSLPGATFPYVVPSTLPNVAGTKYNVTIGVKEDGTGSVTFEKVSNPSDPQSDNTDPI